MGFDGNDRFNPIEKIRGRSDHSRHPGVVEVAMGVDEAGQQDDFAKIGLIAVGRRQIPEASDFQNLVVLNYDRPVFDGR